MDVLIFCFVLLALTAFVAKPLYERAAERAQQEPEDARHAVIIRALSDLEVDRASGLLEEDSYLAERAALEAEASEGTD